MSTTHNLRLMLVEFDEFVKKHDKAIDAIDEHMYYCSEVFRKPDEVEQIMKEIRSRIYYTLKHHEKLNQTTTTEE